jgi:hypothetical protein
MLRNMGSRRQSSSDGRKRKRNNNVTQPKIDVYRERLYRCIRKEEGMDVALSGSDDVQEKSGTPHSQRRRGRMKNRTDQKGERKNQGVYRCISPSLIIACNF